MGYYDHYYDHYYCHNYNHNHNNRNHNHNYNHNYSFGYHRAHSRPQVAKRFSRHAEKQDVGQKGKRISDYNGCRQTCETYALENGYTSEFMCSYNPQAQW